MRPRIVGIGTEPAVAWRDGAPPLARSGLTLCSGLKARQPWLLLALLPTLLQPGCTKVAQPAPQPTRVRPKPVAPPLFANCTASAGISYRWTIAGKRPLNILQTIGNGCAFLDYNNDGNLDILLVGPKLSLYRGDGHGHFTDVTHQMGLDRFSGDFLGCAVGDYDNDGFDDLYISGYRTGLLLHNDDGKRFRDVTSEAGLRPQPWGTCCAFVDVDNDGKLDLFIGNYVQFGPHTEPKLCRTGKYLGACGPKYYPPERDVLYHNDGHGRFHDVSKEWGVYGASGHALGVACADYDGSGRQSIAVANDELPGDLLRNMGGHFKDMAVVAGTAYGSDSQVYGGMGIDWGDYDNDGRPDLAVATFQHEVKNIFHNDGDGFFSERAAALGAANIGLPEVTFGLKWLDYDNDGWLDLAMVSGHVQDNIHQIDATTTYRQSGRLLHNEGGKAFHDASRKAGPDFTRPIVGRGLAVGDFDNDGREDLLVVDSEGAPLLLHNQCSCSNHWLAFRLIGSKSNRDGYGATITIETPGLKQTRRCGTDGSFLSASDRRVHFGLGPARAASRVTVRWPSGERSTLQDVTADRVLTVLEPANAVKVN